MKMPVMLFLFLIIVACFSSSFGQVSSFTYQGRLNSANAPANGNYDLAFTLFGTNSGGSPIAGPVTNKAASVTNGLFTTLLDFGGSAFGESSNWIEIAVRSNGYGAFITLSPRQQVTAAPIAVYASSSGNSVSATSLSGLLPASQITGTLPITALPSAVATNGSIIYHSRLTADDVEPTNVFAGSGEIDANYGTQTFTSGNGAFAGRLAGDNIVIGNDQYLIINVVSPNQVTVWQTVNSNYTGVTNYTVYPNGLNFKDINGNHYGFVANDASVGIVGGFGNGNSGQLYLINGNDVVAQSVNYQPDGYYWCVSGIGPLQGGSLKVSDKAPYDSIAIKPDGFASFRFGITNEHDVSITLSQPIVINNSASTPPSPSSLGANNNVGLWASNGVLYARTSSNGITYVDKQLAP